ncbi:MAG: ADP-ribosylglycohydrolase family protein [Bernardetiaceae bacterium]|nr:ADP-ribosylglycohydrolase family protein [Bernardetiaceae bacterium]
MQKNQVLDALLGVCVGDAVGVPYEFKSREAMQASPATDMIGYGTYNQRPGTWSDDSSLTFCLAESLLHGYDLKDMSKRFIRWKEDTYWSARGRVFDIGITTSQALSRLYSLITNGQAQALAMQKLSANEFDNGNGSLMRILPLLFYIKGKNIEKQFELVWEVSALTHRHIRAAMSCMIYLKIAEKLLQGEDKIAAYESTRIEIKALWNSIQFPMQEQEHFIKVIQNDIRDTPIEELKTGGYVIEVLESSIWFFLQKDNYRDTILSIINLGHDTDTSAAIAGGLAGLYYGKAGIPEAWVSQIARLDDIIKLCEALHQKYP